MLLIRASPPKEKFMSKKFSALNKKIRSLTVIKLLVFAIALGMLAFSVIVFADKVAAIEPNYLFSAAIGAGAAVVFATVTLTVCYPTEKRVAKQLDKKLAMNEKVQTMVEFKDIQSDMIEIQREDTERRLSEMPKKDFKNKKAWVNLILPVLAVAMLVTSVAVPVRTKADDPNSGLENESDEWALDEWHITAVKTLIEEVKASEMVEDGKVKVVSYLETMLSDLEHIKSKSQMKQTVMSVMVKISGVTDGINTYTSVIKALRESDSESVKKYAEAIGSPADPIIESKYLALKSEFKKEELGDKLKIFASTLGIAVKNATAPEDDALFKGILEYSEALSAFDKTVSSLTDEEYDTGLTAVFENAAETVSAALNVQNANRTTTDNANNRLMIIFGISWSELPDELKYPANEEAGTTDGEYDEKDDDIVTGGGLGSGEVIYGSDDAIYDPNKGTHVNYGDVINDYDAKKAADLEERPLDDEIKEAVGDYFADLYYKQEK